MPALADSFSLESEWQQFSSSLFLAQSAGAAEYTDGISAEG